MEGVNLCLTKLRGWTIPWFRLQLSILPKVPNTVLEPLYLIFNRKGEDKMLRSAGAILCCLATPDATNIAVVMNYDKNP